MAREKVLNILIAEDDELIGELLGLILIEMGHLVCATESSEAGTVASAHKFGPDLMIVDYRLNPGSGIEAVDSIQRTRFIPHILVSGTIAAVLELRPNAVTLCKPYTQSLLESAILRATAHA